VSVQFFALSGADVGRSFDARPGDTIGRSPECVLVLRDASISRRHAHLEEVGGRWSVVDDGSRNGISVGSVRRARLELADGDEFLLGEVLLRFRTNAPTASSAGASPSVGRTAARAPAPEITSKPAAVSSKPAEGPRAPEPPRARPAPAPAPVDDGELVLEEAHEIQLGATVVRPQAEAQAARGKALAEQRGRILQYHRASEGGSALSFELAQLPNWQRYALYTLGLLLLAGAAAAAFFGSAFVKERLGGGAEAAPADDSAAQG